MTNKSVVPLIETDVALIVTSPAALAVASPELLTAKTPPLDDIQELEEVRFCVLPSLYVPVALSC